MGVGRRLRGAPPVPLSEGPRLVVGLLSDEQVRAYFHSDDRDAAATRLAGERQAWLRERRTREDGWGAEEAAAASGIAEATAPGLAALMRLVHVALIVVGWV
ncbi:hypothetical protein ACQP1U_14165 [Actinomycetota bacterium]